MKTLVNFLIAFTLFSPRLWCDGELTQINNNHNSSLEELLDYDLSHRYRAKIIGDDKKRSVYICGKLIQQEICFLTNKSPRAITCLGIDF